MVAPNVVRTGTAQSGSIARIAPRLVATPFPPRPFSSGEVTWPSAAENPATSPHGAPYLWKYHTGA